MNINTKKLDEIYKEWSGKSHLENEKEGVHSSSECTEFAEFVLRHNALDTKFHRMKEEHNQLFKVVGKCRELQKKDRDSLSSDEIDELDKLEWNIDMYLKNNPKLYKSK